MASSVQGIAKKEAVIPTIRTLAKQEKPRERCLAHGAAVLSLRECLAVLLGSGPPGSGCLGVSQAILKRVSKESENEENFFSAMDWISDRDGEGILTGISGLGGAGKARILVACEIARRYANAKAGGITENEPRALIPVGLLNAKREWIGCVPILTDGSYGAFLILERGVRARVELDPVDFFATLLQQRPKGFVLFHNHPSGILRASKEDLRLTRWVSRVSESLGLVFAGHAIVCGKRFKWIRV